MFFCSKRASLSIRDMVLLFHNGFNGGGKTDFLKFLDCFLGGDFSWGNDVYKLKSEMECFSLFVWRLWNSLEIYMQELNFVDFLYLYAP